MKRPLTFLCLLSVLAAAALAPAQTPAPATQQIQQRVESYLRKLYAWGPAFTLDVSAPVDSPAPGFWQVSVTITAGGQSDSGLVYVSKDGRFLLRGEINDMREDPFAANRRRIRLEGAPSYGPAGAAVVVVDYSDFQCPHCRELAGTLSALKARYPQVRFVAKQFPLEQIHPWAMTAATAAVCAWRQKPDAYWTVSREIFANQDNITPGNAWTRMREFAAMAGLDVEIFTACLASPEARDAVDRDLKEGIALNIANTPTVFVNGRRVVGADRGILEQYINYELSAAAASRQP